MRLPRELHAHTQLLGNRPAKVLAGRLHCS
jgi:hypothetical protein